MNRTTLKTVEETERIDARGGFHVVNAAPDQSERWDQFVGQTEGGTIYHTSTWSRIIARCYGFGPVLLTLESDDGEMGGIFPLCLVQSRITGNRLVALPYTNAAGTVCSPGVDSRPLLVAAIDLARRQGCRYLEVRGQPGESDDQNQELRRHDYYGTFVLALDSDADRVRNGFDKRARRGIARASKSGVRVSFANAPSAVNDFYHLNLLTRRKHGVPPQPLRFFETLWEAFRPRGEVEIILAEWQGTIVAGMVLLAYKDTVTYAYGASDQRYLRCAPNHALFDAALGWAAERGYRYFDFGRTAPDNQGLMEFKQQWGAQFIPLPYYHWPVRGGFVTEAEDGWKHRLFTACWRRLPLSLTAALGPPLYRHLA